VKGSHENHGNTEAVSSSPEKWALEHKMARTTSRAGKKTGGGLKKMSCKTMKQNENEQKLQKKTVHAGRGRETKWEIQLKRSRSPTTIQIRSGFWPGCRDEGIHEIPIAPCGVPASCGHCWFTVGA